MIFEINVYFGTLVSNVKGRRERSSTPRHWSKPVIEYSLSSTRWRTSTGIFFTSHGWKKEKKGRTTDATRTSPCLPGRVYTLQNTGVTVLSFLLSRTRCFGASTVNSGPVGPSVSSPFACGQKRVGDTRREQNVITWTFRLSPRVLYLPIFSFFPDWDRSSKRSRSLPIDERQDSEDMTK